MHKRAYFESDWGAGWPELKWLERYFLTSAGRRQFFEEGNDSWGLTAQGVDGSDLMQPNNGRIDINLTILGNPKLGVLLCHQKWGGGLKQTYYSKGDLMRLGEWVTTVHGDRMPIGLFIPFESAWTAVRQFIEANGALPTGIVWVGDGDLPRTAFPAS
ncbi:MAG: hypothetical protein QOC56_1233 [Alphaproteobacteria bacterium]|nr:hypothetical protein [Alphaproteobacteria bacterium]